jgi:hypothetical protein
VHQTQCLVKIQQGANEYSDRLVASLESAEIDDYTITFKFKNGAEIKRVFNNEVDRKSMKNEVKKYG